MTWSGVERTENLGDFRSGAISMNYRKFGNSNCACALMIIQRHGLQ